MDTERRVRIDVLVIEPDPFDHRRIEFGVLRYSCPPVGRHPAPVLGPGISWSGGTCSLVAVGQRRVLEDCSLVGEARAERTHVLLIEVVASPQMLAHLLREFVGDGSRAHRDQVWTCPCDQPDAEAFPMHP